ncbi:hypothetical protein H6P81_018575 [Aristolochia fimbriata]|uniref:Stigma-specific STIG1-like protein 1 n=1 Tax=Aristolochia fimbriata TaxID=158543 RepID=A0AAV7E4F7_ARIFI|nr:hypothetical protein H6P81_018575 [Aristolochia fimbriata]
MNPSKKTLLPLIIALSLLMAHATAASGHEEEDEEEEGEEKEMIEAGSTSFRGFGSFLPQNKHTCKRDPSICFVKGSPGPFCCKKVCVDVKVDRRNCGGCKNKCKKKDICCSGRCVFAYMGCDPAGLALQA